MKTYLHSPLAIGNIILPHMGNSRSFMSIVIALAMVVLAFAPQVKAQSGHPAPEPFYGLMYDFDKFVLGIDDTNQYVNFRGASATSYFLFEAFSKSQLKKPSEGISPDVGTLFGTASLGGRYGYGTVFAANTDGSGFMVLHDFTGGSDGNFPSAGLISSGNTLYGTTQNGGNVDDGTVFALDTSGNNFTVLHHFTARYYYPYTNHDGGNPTAALILSGNMLYGTASDGGSADAGTVFALNLANTNFTVLHSFSAANYDANFNLTNSDGAYPNARLLLSGDTLYGTANRGGTGGAGTVFAIKTNGMGFTNLYSFTAVDPLTLTNRDGANPQTGLILSGDMLYGTAFRGGNSTLGTVFAVNVNGTVFTNLHSFTGGNDGAEPAGELTLLTNLLIGTASIGGDTSLNNGGNGTVFALNTNGTDFTVLYSFPAGNYDPTLTGNNLTNSDGAYPRAGLVFAEDTLYGVASLGGSRGNGTVFSLSLASAPQLTILDVLLSGTNLVINGANGQSGENVVTLMNPDLSLPLNQWAPVATNILITTGNFTFTATNVVDSMASRRFYILQTR